MPSSNPKVAIVYTKPKTVLQDISELMHLADYQSFLPKFSSTLLKNNISWQHYKPACSTTPWQLEGVIKTLLDNGYKDLIPAHNGTVVVDPVMGAINNKHTPVEQKYGLKIVFLDFKPVKWLSLIHITEHTRLGMIS